MPARSAAVTDGRATSINILTAAQPWRLPWLNQRFNLWLVRRPEWQVRKIVGKPPLPAQLKRLNFLYSAVWARVGRFPDVSPPARGLDRRRHRSPREHEKWMLFCSNFTREWEPYVQSFLDVLDDGIHTIWGQSVDFPNYPDPGSRYDTVTWESSRLIRSQRYYCAYRWATTNDVRAALRVHRELLAFAFQQQALANLGRSDGVVADFESFLARIQHCLVDVPPPPVGTRRRLGPANANGCSNLVSLMPIVPGRVDETLEQLAAYPKRRPFAEVPGVHFARFAMIDRTVAGRHPSTDVPLDHSWLLFVADFDGTFDDIEDRQPRPPEGERQRFLQAVLEQESLSRVWANCHGFDDPDTRLDLLDGSVVERFVLFRDYPGSTLADVLDALEVHAYLLSWLRRAGALNATRIAELLDVVVRLGEHDEDGYWRARLQ